MRAIIWGSSREFEMKLGAALAKGAGQSGDTVEYRMIGQWTEGADTGDLMIVVGMHAARLPLAMDSYERGRRVLHLDKGITRTGAREGRNAKSEYWRFSLDEHQPVRLISRMEQLKVSSDRRREQSWKFTKWRHNPDGPILVCPPGRRECLWYSLGTHIEFAEGMVRQVAQAFPDAELLFRPKPRHVMQHQWEDPPRGAVWDNWQRGISETLAGCRLMVAYSTSATLNAILAGIPIVTLGPNWAHRLAGPLKKGGLYMPPSEEITADLNSLAYLQWSWDELRSGEAWKFIKTCVELGV